MRILLDENVDWRLTNGLPGHEVKAVPRLGWSGIQNGLLLKKAEENGFDVLITMDANIGFQHQLAGHAIAIVVLRARSNRLTDTLPLMPKVLQSLPYIEKGTARIIE